MTERRAMTARADGRPVYYIGLLDVLMFVLTGGLWVIFVLIFKRAIPAPRDGAE